MLESNGSLLNRCISSDDLGSSPNPLTDSIADPHIDSIADCASTVSGDLNRPSI
jgi:hypothetical protein